MGSQKRLGFLAGDLAGFPQGRRPVDDVVDIASRAVAGILAGPMFGARVGDGVNTNEDGFGTTFPYVKPAHSGRNSHHTGPGQAGCSGQPDGICPPSRPDLWPPPAAATKSLSIWRIIMKRIAALLLLAFSTTTLVAQIPSVSVEHPSAAPILSPAERSMAQARKLIEKNPKDFEAYNVLALALSRRARETSDVTFYTQGEDALQKSFAVSPDNFDGQRIRVWLLLGKHEFAAALEAATKLNQRMPDDVMSYGFLTDANVELGNYKEAEAAAQWMLDLRAGNMPGLTRAAYLRELCGDIDGALELMNMAYQSTPPTEVEDGAWIVTQMAHLNLAVGKVEEAETLLRQALKMFPNYHYALGNLAKVRIRQKRYDEAVEF